MPDAGEFVLAAIPGRPVDQCWRDGFIDSIQRNILKYRVDVLLQVTTSLSEWQV